MTLALGILVMILGTYSNLEAAAGKNIVVPIEAPNIKIPGPDPDVSRDVPIGDSKKDSVLLEAQRLQPPPPRPSLQNIEQRKEPPVPVEPVIKKEAENVASKPPELPPVKDVPPEVKKPPEKPVSLAPDVVKTLEVNKNGSSKGEPDQKEVHVIHEDAIAKEDLELKEQRNQQKLEDDQKQKELLDKLEQHKEEQKKLLQEQQNILEEIKSRDPKSVEGLKVEEVSVKPVAPINPEKFSDNIDKIQEVIDDLKERKQVMDKNKGEKIAEEKRKFAERKIEIKPVLLSSKQEEVKNLTVDSVKKLDKPRLDVKDVLLPGRDILEEKTEISVEREKRDVDESCKKTVNDVEGTERDKYFVKPFVKTQENVESVAHDVEISAGVQEKEKHVDNVQSVEKQTNVKDVVSSIQQSERLSSPPGVKISLTQEIKPGVNAEVLQRKQDIRRRK